MFKKTVSEPTPEERINRASLKAGSALDVFRQAADDLDAAADEHEAITDELDAEASRLQSLADHASTQAIDSRNAASRVRSLLG